jgi:hypothetical protein
MPLNDVSHYGDIAGRAHGRLSKWWDGAEAATGE